MFSKKDADKIGVLIASRSLSIVTVRQIFGPDFSEADFAAIMPWWNNRGEAPANPAPEAPEAPAPVLPGFFPVAHGGVVGGEFSRESEASDPAPFVYNADKKAE